MNKLLKAAALGAAAMATVATMAPVAQADGYGTAGCGLGSIIFGDKPGLIQVIAATFNGTSGNQTFAISTGTSNCGKSESSVEAAAAFIQTNREAFAKDAARGQGETIASLATLAGCQNPGQVGTVLQGEFGKVFPSEKTSTRKSRSTR